MPRSQRNCLISVLFLCEWGGYWHSGQDNYSLCGAGSHTAGHLASWALGTKCLQHCSCHYNNPKHSNTFLNVPRVLPVENFWTIFSSKSLKYLTKPELIFVCDMRQESNFIISLQIPISPKTFIQKLILPPTDLQCYLSYTKFPNR